MQFGCRYGGKAISTGEISFTQVLKVSPPPQNLLERHCLFAVHTASSKSDQGIVCVVSNDYGHFACSCLYAVVCLVKVKVVKFQAQYTGSDTGHILQCTLHANL